MTQFCRRAVQPFQPVAQHLERVFAGQLGGLGLSASLPGFTTTSPAGTGLASVGGVGEFPAGHLLDVEPGTGYVGAVVTSRPAGLASWHLEGYPPLEEIPS